MNRILKRDNAKEGRQFARCIPPHLDGNACQFSSEIPLTAAGVFRDETKIPVAPADGGKDPIMWHAVCMHGKEKKKQFLMRQHCSQRAARATGTEDSANRAIALAAHLDL